MSFLRKSKKRKKKVEYQDLGKGEARWLRIGGTDIVAMRLPEEKRVEVEGEAGIPAKAGGKYKRDETAKWQVFIQSKDTSLMPLDAWKKTFAETISTTTFTTVTESDISIATVTPPPPTWTSVEPCPKCGRAIVDVESKYCSNCGAKLFEIKKENK